MYAICDSALMFQLVFRYKPKIINVKNRYIIRYFKYISGIFGDGDRKDEIIFTRNV